MVFSKWLNWPKRNKNRTSRMFDANNISTRSYARDIRLNVCRLALTKKRYLRPSRHKIHSKTGILRFKLRIFTGIFHSKIRRKLRCFSLDRKNIILIKKNVSEDLSLWSCGCPTKYKCSFCCHGSLPLLKKGIYQNYIA